MRVMWKSKHEVFFLLFRVGAFIYGHVRKWPAKCGLLIMCKICCKIFPCYDTKNTLMQFPHYRRLVNFYKFCKNSYELARILSKQSLSKLKIL